VPVNRVMRGLLWSALLLVVSFSSSVSQAAPSMVSGREPDYASLHPEGSPYLRSVVSNGGGRQTPATDQKPLTVGAVPVPSVGAEAAIVVEYPSGRILYQKAAHTRLAMASTTKITTAILALEYGKLDDVVTVTSQDMIWGTKMGLQPGERQTLRNLLYGLLIPSGNDAAMTIARYVGSKTMPVRPGEGPVNAFIRLMNKRVVQFGLKESHYANPHGLDAAGHYSSAYDLASLTWYAMHFDTFNQIVRQPSYQAPGHTLQNLNKMLARYPGAQGVKTGYTGDAGLCLVAAATRDGRQVISVVLNAPHWIDDSTAMLDYGFAKLSGAPPANAVLLARAGEKLSIVRTLAGSLPGKKK
jgi:D-alanyl-D-alanine carboxypeptidase